jgi:transposase-like protein
MMRKRRTADQVAQVLREVERDLAKGPTIADVCRKIGVAQTTYYRWFSRIPTCGLHNLACEP